VSLEVSGITDYSDRHCKQLQSVHPTIRPCGTLGRTRHVETRRSEILSVKTDRICPLSIQTEMSMDGVRWYLHQDGLRLLSVCRDPSKYVKMTDDGHMDGLNPPTNRRITETLADWVRLRCPFLEHTRRPWRTPGEKQTWMCPFPDTSLSIGNVCYNAPEMHYVRSNIHAGMLKYKSPPIRVERMASILLKRL